MSFILMVSLIFFSCYGQLLTLEESKNPGLKVSFNKNSLIQIESVELAKSKKPELKVRFNENPHIIEIESVKSNMPNNETKLDYNELEFKITHVNRKLDVEMDEIIGIANAMLIYYEANLIEDGIDINPKQEQIDYIYYASRYLEFCQSKYRLDTLEFKEYLRACQDKFDLFASIISGVKKESIPPLKRSRRSKLVS